MPRISMMLLMGSLLFAGCDLFSDSDEEPPGEVLATLNGQTWSAFPRAAVVYTEQVFEPRNDSLISMQFDALRANGFRSGALVMTFPFRGVGTYEIPYNLTGRTEADSTDPALPDTLRPIVAFYDTQHDTIVAQMLLEEDDSFEVTIQEVDRRRGHITGTFRGTLVYHQGRPSVDPVRNYPDTLRFTSGAFESQVEFVTAEE